MHAGECEIDDAFLERAVGKVDQMITDTYGLHLPTNIKNIHDRLHTVICLANLLYFERTRDKVRGLTILSNTCEGNQILLYFI